MLFTWQSSADSPLQNLNPNTFLRLTRHGSVLIYCCLLHWWPWHSTLCCWTKHCHISLPLWQLLKVKQTLKFFAEGDFNRRKKAEIMGYWNWIFTVQNRVQICFVRLEFDSHTLHTEPPIHVGTETWITGWRPTKWSNSESPHFHAFKIPNTKLMT